MIREPALQLTGLHSHIGSQIFDTAGFEAAAHRVVGLLGQVHQATGEVLGELNLGRRFRHRLPRRGRPGEPARRRRQAARRHRRRVRAARAAGAAPGRRAGPRDRRARHRDAVRDRHHQAGAAGRQRRAGHPAGAQLRLGRRRDERQHPHRPLRRQLHLRAGQPHLRRPAGAVPRGRQALRERRHPGPRPVAALGRPARRPARRGRDRRLLLVDGQQLQLPAQAAGGRRAGRRGHRDRPASDTVRRVRPRRGPRRPARALPGALAARPEHAAGVRS